MKIIEAMKKIKDLQRKSEDLTAKIQANVAILSYETPVYPDQQAQIDSWIQSFHDIIKEIEALRLAIQRTNLATTVEIELGKDRVKKNIAAWVHRRRDLAKAEQRLWTAVNDRGLKDGQVKQSNGELMDIKVRRFYDPRKRDEMVELYTSEPSAIDARLEIVNAITDLVD